MLNIFTQFFFQKKLIKLVKISSFGLPGGTMVASLQDFGSNPGWNRSVWTLHVLSVHVCVSLHRPKHAS